MEEIILSFMDKYGIAFLLISVSGILFVGILKFFKTFEKLEKTRRKYIYVSLSAIFTILGSVVYLFCTESFGWIEFAKLASSTYVLNQTIYNIYENIGMRELIRKIGSVFLKLITNKYVVHNDETKIKVSSMEKLSEGFATTNLSEYENIKLK